MTILPQYRPHLMSTGPGPWAWAYGPRPGPGPMWPMGPGLWARAYMGPGPHANRFVRQTLFESRQFHEHKKEPWQNSLQNGAARKFIALLCVTKRATPFLPKPAFWD